MISVVETIEFSRWLQRLRDPIAKARISVRVQRLAFGNPGEARPVGEGVSEMRIDHGPGYRVYFVRRRPVVAVLLCGGDKGSQERDIIRARMIAREVQDGD